MRTVLRPAALAAVLLLLAPAAFAEEGGDEPAADEPSSEPEPDVTAELRNDAGFQYYEKAAARILKAAGEKVWEASVDAFRAGFHQYAIEQAERAVRFDPQHKAAREYLCYVRGADGKWTRDEEAWNAPGKEKQNKRAAAQGASESEENFRKRLDKWREESLDKADRYVAAKYAELGDDVAAKGFALQAKKGWEASLRLDPDNAKARKGLGYKKLGKVWLTEKQDKARKDAAKGEERKEASAWDDFFKTKLNKVDSRHFRFESPYPVAELMEYAAAAETAYAYYLADIGRDPGEDLFEPFTFVVMQTDDQWNAFVDVYGGEDKEFTRKMAGTGDGHSMRGIRTTQGSSVAQRKDSVVHQTVHHMNRKLWNIGNGKHAWADEGLAYYYTLKVLESVSTFCVAQKKGNYAKPGDEGGMKEWESAANWKTKTKDLVRAKQDVPMRTLVYQPITQLEFAATVKAWCLVTWFMDTNRDKWLSCLSQFADGGIPEAVLQGTWDKGLEELDDAWHHWVLKTY